jgi:butyrate kinase
MDYNILVINPGSTSDEIGYYAGDKTVFELSISYAPRDLAPFENGNVVALSPLKKTLILSALARYKVELKDINAVIGRGGIIKPVESGVYAVNDAMLKDLNAAAYGNHTTNLGGILARELALSAGCQAFIADPPVIDEMNALARYGGIPELPRKSVYHALNQKRVARLTAQKLNKKYEDCNFVVLHAGGGVSAGAHSGGKVIDVNNSLNGEGPMTPQRAGTLPACGLAQMCFDGKLSKEEIFLKIKGRGGMIAHTGTNNFKELRDFIKSGNKDSGSLIVCSREEAETFRDAMIYQFAKYVAYTAAALEGKIDALIFTGGLTYDDYLVSELKRKTRWLCANAFVYPGSDEKAALREAALGALREPLSVKEYK